jgi:hypothetical protein
MRSAVGCLLAVALSTMFHPCHGGDDVRTASPPSDAAVRLQNLGLLDQDRVVEHTFVIQNTSDKALRLVGERVTCGCISIVERPEVIPARGDGRVVVQLRTAGKRGMVRERAVVRTDDPSRQYFQLTLSATVRGEWTDPDRLDFGNLRTDESAVREVYVIASGLPQATFRSATADDPHIRLFASPASSDAQARSQDLQATQHVRVELSARGLTPGPYVSFVKVVTGRDQTIQIPINAYVTGEMAYRPAKILWATAAAGGRSTRSCVLVAGESARAIDPAKVTIKVDHRYLQATMRSWEKGGQHGYELRATLEVPSDHPKKELLKGEIIGTFEGRRIFSVPYMAYVQPGGAPAASRAADPS